MQGDTKGPLMKRHLFHRVMFVILRYTVAPFIKRAMRYKCKKQKGPDTPSFIIANHNTDLDPVLIAMSFRRHMYFLSSEHSLRNSFRASLLKIFFDPIPINKSRTDVSAIKEMLRRVKAGANVCFFAEGDRSFSGTTQPITSSTAKLVKTSGADLITFRLEGGYLTSPRWSRNYRQGKMAGRVVNRYSGEELKTKTIGQINSLIEQDIYEDAYERQKEDPVRYRGKNLAESIETTLYLCPECEKFGSIRSENDRFYCSCGLEGTYSETGIISGELLPFSTVSEWDQWQTGKLEEIITAAGDETICSDEDQKLYTVQSVTGSTLVGRGPISIDRTAFHCAGIDFALDRITKIVVAGQMTLLFALKDGPSYEVHSDIPRSALKYREIFRVLSRKSNP